MDDSEGIRSQLTQKNPSFDHKQVEFAESQQMLLAFTQHSLNRVKSENKELIIKNTSLIKQLRQTQQELDSLKRDKENMKFISKNKDFQSKGALNNIQNTEQNRRIFQQKPKEIQRMCMHIEQIQREGILVKNDLSKAMVANLELIRQIDEIKKENRNLIEERIKMFEIMKHLEADSEQKIKKYEEKLSVYELQNIELKKNVEDLLLELKIYERQKEIEKLLVYEKQIDHKGSKHTKKGQMLKNQRKINFQESKMEGYGANQIEQHEYSSPWNKNTNRTNEKSRINNNADYFGNFSENLEESDVNEIINLLKQKNAMLLKQLTEKQQRNKTLQSIVCAQMTKF